MPVEDRIGLVAPGERSDALGVFVNEPLLRGLRSESGPPTIHQRLEVSDKRHSDRYDNDI